VAAYHVVWECVVEQWLGVRRTTIRFMSIKSLSKSRETLQEVNLKSLKTKLRLLRLNNQSVPLSKHFSSQL